MNGIGWAVKQLRDGKRVCRHGWNGPGMWLLLIDPIDSRSATRYAESIGCVGGVSLETLPWIGMKTANDKFVPWLASQTDLLAIDWEILS